MNTIYYTVAGHSFAVVLPDELADTMPLKSYEPFLCECVSSPLFVLEVKLADNLSDCNVGDLLQCMNEEAPYIWVYRNGDTYDFGFSNTRKNPECLLHTSSGYSQNILYIPSQGNAEFALNNSLMLLYAFTTAASDTLLVHASVIRKGDYAYMFLGKSGTGKSTHSRLWLQHVEDCELLNDDNPVIRVFDDKAVVYGSPWSGKTPCYRNEQATLRAVVRLSQAPFNKITALRNVQAYASLMPACSCMKWNREMADGVHRSVEKSLRVVSFYHLECLPDAEAAHLCFDTVSR